MHFHPPPLSEAWSRASLSWRTWRSVDGNPLSLYSWAKPVIKEAINPDSLGRLEEQLALLGKARTEKERSSVGVDIESTLSALIAEARSRLSTTSEEASEVLEVLRSGIRRLLAEAHAVEQGERPIVAELRRRLASGELPLFPVGQHELPRRDRVDPISFLEQHYGEFLLERLVFQSDLRQVDPGLLRALENRVHYLRRRKGQQISLADYLPALGDAPELQGMSNEAARRTPRFAGALADRARRVEKSQKD